VNKRLYIVVIVLTTLSLIGIVVIQGYWIKSAIDNKEDTFTYSIQQVLSVAAKEIEQNEIDKYVTKIMNLRENALPATKENHLREFIYVQENKDNKETFIYKHGVLEEDYYFPPNNQTAAHLGVHSLSDTIAIKRYTRQENLQRLKDKTADNQAHSNLVTNYEKLSELSDIERLMIEESFKSIIRKKSINDRVNTDDITRLLKNLLNKRGLNLHFECAIYNKNVLSKVHSRYFEPNETKEYRTVLFGGNSSDDSLYELAVIFPERERFVLSSIISIATLSMVFTLMVIGVFIVTIHQLITQRRISEIKTDFINNMTHEFKTPIATMSLVLDSLKTIGSNNNNPEKILHYVEILKQENKRMLAQVENILQISKLEKGSMQLEREPMDVHEVIITAISHVQTILNERQGQIHVHFLASNGDVSANESHLVNVFVNVIENAIKYSPEQPEIDIYTENIKNKVLIRVKDKGQGMSKQAGKHIFDKFYREHTGDLHNVKGHGLGLAYVKTIVEYHQGTITVESEKDKGSTFFIKLPTI